MNESIGFFINIVREFKYRYVFISFYCCDILLMLLFFSDLLIFAFSLNLIFKG